MPWGWRCLFVCAAGWARHRFGWRWPAAFRVMFHAIPSFGPHCGRGRRRAPFRLFVHWPRAGPAAIRTAHPGGQRGCCTGIHAAGHISPGEGNHHTPNRHPANGGGDRGLCHAQRQAHSRHTRGNRQPPGPDSARDARIGHRGGPRHHRGTGRPGHPGNLAGRARRDRARCAGQRGRELPWFWQRLAGPVVQRHHGAVQHCGAPRGQLDLRPGGSHWRPVELPVRLGRRGRVHQLHHQNARAHRLHRSAGACWLAPAAGSVHRHQPPPGLCGHSRRRWHRTLRTAGSEPP